MGISMAIPTTEKNRPGPQRLKFPPWLPKLEPLPKRFFSRINHEAPICAGHLRINRMKQKYNLFSIRRPSYIHKNSFFIDFFLDISPLPQSNIQ